MTGNVAAFIPGNSAYKHASSVESISLVAGEPIGRRAAVQGWPFGLVHAYAAIIRIINTTLVYWLIHN